MIGVVTQAKGVQYMFLPHPTELCFMFNMPVFWKTGLFWTTVNFARAQTATFPTDSYGPHFINERD